ncbi:hypothetical protein DFH09DRAFT_1335501 [Mycena vulgaris]|nr:hypothetical protein DFH09DRAFT_1335501 [Mycena vulgaris]
MTQSTNASPGTEFSVPGAASPVSDPQTIAALQVLLASMTANTSEASSAAPVITVAPPVVTAIPPATMASAHAQTVAALQALLASMTSNTSDPSSAQTEAPAPPAGLSVIPVALPIATPTPSPAVTPAPGMFLTRGPWVAGSLYQVVPGGPLTHIVEAAGDDQPLWYCITRGHYVGVTLSHALALAAVVRVSGSAMKSYKTQVLAVEAFNEMLQFHMVAVVA